VDSAAPQRLEQESFDALYRGHVRDVYRYSLSLVRDPIDAEDVTQTTFLNALEAFGENPPRKPRQWLITIARNLVHDRHRQSQRRPQQVELTEVPAPLPEDVRVRADEIVSALQGVPSRQRVALLLDGLEGRSRAEIAAELGIEEQTVANLLARGRQNLRLQLDEGMSCRRARIVAPKPWGASRDERRAALNHLRHCERCAGVAKPLFGLGSVLLWLRDGAAHGAGLGKVAPAAGGSSLATKAAVVVTVGTLAGGVALQGATSGPAGRPATPEVAAITGLPGATEQVVGERRTEIQRSPVVETERPARPAAPAPASRKRSTTAGSPVRSSPGAAVAETAPSGSGAARTAALVPAGAPFEPSPTTYEPTVQAQGGTAAPTAQPAEERGMESDAAAPAAMPRPVEGGSDDLKTPAPPAQESAASAGRAAPGQQTTSVQPSPGRAPASASARNDPGEAAPGGGRTTAPGKQESPGDGQATAPGQQDTAGGGRTTAPGQEDNPGIGQATAPGQQKDAGSGQATAPGQQDNPGQTTAPGQQDNPGNGQAAPPGRQDDPEHGTPGGGQASALGRQDNPGNGEATAPGQQGGSPGNGQATAPGRQESPGGGQATAPELQKNPG
jgi:RNA polymerase sigma-70 factor (ECF subfamily)